MDTQPKSNPISGLNDLENVLNEYFGKKAPAMPANIKELIVKLSPWITLIMMVMLVPAILLFLGVGAFVMPFSYIGGVTAGFSYTVTFIFSLVMIVLEVMALPGLFKRARSAWKLLFYISLISAVENVLLFNLGGLVIGSLISFYILFQVRELYK